MNSQQYDKDNWFDRNGVPRPDHIPFLTEEELEKKFKEIRETTVHGGWKMQGNYLFCTKCQFQHGDFIAPEYILQGTDNKGLPILKKIDL